LSSAAAISGSVATTGNSYSRPSEPIREVLESDESDVIH
jgi:hypothetical protein